MKYEKPQPGNPHQLTLFQHTFPAASIARFAGDDGRVDVHLVDQRKTVRLKPDNQIFCAKRVWDQRAESGFMKDIEDIYQPLADAVAHDGKRDLNGEDQRIITDMFAIWKLREDMKRKPIPNQRIKGIVGVAKDYNRDDREFLEKNHIGTIGSDLLMPGRHLAGIRIQLALFQAREQMRCVQWGVSRALEGQFLVPDTFPNVRILPLTPSLCFVSPCQGDELNKNQVTKINSLAIESSKVFYFSNDLNKCS